MKTKSLGMGKEKKLEICPLMLSHKPMMGHFGQEQIMV